MKVLMIGRGVIGTIYGWALSEAGMDVTHVVRRPGLPATVNLDLLDERRGFPRHRQTRYAPRTVTQIRDQDGFDLIIVATKHYQCVQAIEQYRAEAPEATVLLFTANWDGTEEIDRIVPRSSMLWGYAKATGGFDQQGILVATVDPVIRIGMLEGSDPEKFDAVTALFRKAGFELDVKANIIEWLWMHHAINAGGIGACLWAGGIAEATRSYRNLRSGVWAVRDALSVLAARGVNPESYPEARGVLKTPVWLACLAATYGIRCTEKGRRLLRASHFNNSIEEMKRFYFDVLNTGESYGVAMPHLSAFRERIET